jgi:hypothetical protein
MIDFTMPGHLARVAQTWKRRSGPKLVLVPGENVILRTRERPQGHCHVDRRHAAWASGVDRRVQRGLRYSQWSTRTFGEGSWTRQLREGIA